MLRREEVDDHVAKVHQDPAGVIIALDMNCLEPGSDEVLVDSIDEGAQMCAPL